jgi:hypothetical protein
MAALTRKFKKIFGKDSSNNGVFGSAAALAPATSTNPETIESLAAFLTGWEDATEGGLKLPTLEDMQGLKYDTDYHLAYIYQDGLQNYNSLTTYYINNYVREESTAKIWKSLVDNNTGNTLVEGANWTLVGNLANIPTSPIVDASSTVKGIVELLTNAELAAGTDTTRAATAAAIASLFGASSRAATSLQARSPIKVSGAFVEKIEQCGQISIAGSPTSGSVTFPITFPNAVVSVIVTPNGTTGGAGEANICVNTVSTTGFTIRNSNANAALFYWLAIGY